MKDTKQAQPVHVRQFHSWSSNLPWQGQEVCAGGGRALEGEVSAMLLLRAYFSGTVACLPIRLLAVGARFVRAPLSFLTVLRSGGSIVADTYTLTCFVF